MPARRVYVTHLQDIHISARVEATPTPTLESQREDAATAVKHVLDERNRRASFQFTPPAPSPVEPHPFPEAVAALDRLGRLCRDTPQAQAFATLVVTTCERLIALLVWHT